MRTCAKCAHAFTGYGGSVTTIKVRLGARTSSAYGLLAHLFSRRTARFVWWIASECEKTRRVKAVNVSFLFSLAFSPSPQHGRKPARLWSCFVCSTSALTGPWTWTRHIRILTLPGPLWIRQGAEDPCVPRGKYGEVANYRREGYSLRFIARFAAPVVLVAQVPGTSKTL